MEDSMPTVGDNLTAPEAVNPEVVAAVQEQAQQQVQQTQQQTAGGADFSGIGDVAAGAVDVGGDLLISGVSTEGVGDAVGEFFGGVAEVAGGALEFIGDLLGGL